MIRLEMKVLRDAGNDIKSNVLMAPVNAAWFELSAHRPRAGPGGGGVGVVGGAIRRSAQRDCSCWTCPAGDTQGKYSCASVVYLQIHPCFVDGDFCVLFNNSFFFFFLPRGIVFYFGRVSFLHINTQHIKKLFFNGFTQVSAFLHIFPTQSIES